MNPLAAYDRSLWLVDDANFMEVLFVSRTGALDRCPAEAVTITEVNANIHECFSLPIPEIR